MTVDERQALRGQFLHLALANSGTMCYANSAILCYLWASLSRVAFQTTDWGTFAPDFSALLAAADSTPVFVDSFQWFLNIIAHWNASQQQADSAEFTNRFLTWVGSNIVSNMWERRVAVGENVAIHDQGAYFQPITLQLDPDMITHDEIQLATLLRLWHTDLGMLTGLTSPSDLVVLHIDRFVNSPSGRVRKLNTAVRFCWSIDIPVFQSSSECTWEPYQLVAAFSHHGGSERGHYQAILKTFPELSDPAAPSMWLFCDDGRVPERCWMFPPEFEAGVTCLWLCRTSSVELHHLSPETVEPSDDHSAVLAMLQAK